MEWLEQNDPYAKSTTEAAITKRNPASAKAAEEQAARDAATVATNIAGHEWAANAIEWLKARAFAIGGNTFYPLALEYWQADFEKIVQEANERKLSLSDEANLTGIIKNLMVAGEVHASDLLTGATITGRDLMTSELIGELLKLPRQRRDMRSAEEFLKTDAAILAEERSINDELLMRDLDAEFQRLARVEPSFHGTMENRQKLFDYCRANDLPLRQESLATAFREAWSKGLIGKIPNVDITVGVTNARINPEKWRDESDEANAFRRAVKKMSSDEYNAALEDPDFRQKADAWL